MYSTSACRRSLDPSSGREISGFEEMCLIRWSAAIRMLAVRVPEDGVRGAVPGSQVRLEDAVAQLQELAVCERDR